MPYNPETEQFFQAPATIVDSTPDGDTVQEGFDDRLTPAMEGVYTDLNLLKENGMIGVGIPATTTSRGIGRVATLADVEPGAEVTNGPAFLAAGSEAVTPTPTAHAVPQADEDGKLDAWVSLAGKANNDLSNLEPAAKTVIRAATKVTLLGTRTTTGSWTLTDCEIGRMIHIIADRAGVANSERAAIFISDTAAARGLFGSGATSWNIGQDTTNYATGNSCSFEPKASSVTINVHHISGITLYAVQ